MGLNLHCTLKCCSLEVPLASTTDVAAMMATLNEDGQIRGRIPFCRLYIYLCWGLVCFTTWNHPSVCFWSAAGLSTFWVWLMHQSMAFGFDQHASQNNNKSFQSARLPFCTPTHPLEGLKSVLLDFETREYLWDANNRFTHELETALTSSCGLLQSGNTPLGYLTLTIEQTRSSF